MSAMTTKRLVDSLVKIQTFVGDRERQVEHVYNEVLQYYFPDIAISNPYKCDGYFETPSPDNKKHTIRMMMEYKYDRDLTSPMERAKILVQLLFYLKKFEDSGKNLPNVLFVGDVNECFVLNVNDLLKYLGEPDVDWDAAPSGAADKHPELVFKLASDENIHPFVYNVDNDFDIDMVFEQIVNQTDNVVRKVRISEHNIDNVFKHFEKKVVGKKSNLPTKEVVSLFINCLLCPDDYYIHPKKKNHLATPYGEVKVNGNEYLAFFSVFADNYSPSEKMKFTEIADRLIEDTDRRKSGDFWTPTTFVDYAHERITKVFGENWKDEYVVWDCCCGTKNLTRDYKFKELYCSTLFQSELEMAKKYNPEATTFQYDFLNDDFEKLPDGLKNAFKEKKRILFLMNPPYATASVKSTELGKNKAGLCQTMVNKQMKSDKIGRCSENLLAQFFYRIMMFKKQYGADISIGVFCKPIYLSGGTYNKFRDKFLKDFKYEDGFLFNAGHFSDVSAAWGIDFTIWTSGESIDKNNFNHDLVDTDDNGEIVKIGEKDIYNLDSCGRMVEWMGSVVGDKKCFPNMSSGLRVVEGNNSCVDDFIGTILFDNNDVQHSAQGVCLFSGVSKCGHLGYKTITPSNFLRCTCAFAARKLVQGNWINDKDEYLAPDTSNPNFHQFEMDSVIYSLFHSSSQQSSLRQIDYKGKKWDIKNEFFFMSREEMMNLANENNNDDLYNDARTSEDRFVYKFIQEHINEFSEEAKAVLDKASELVRKSFKYRWLWGQDHEEYQINNFDCGWYQLKALLKDMMPNELKEFKELYKSLSEKLAPQVYNLGFLRK